MTGELTTFSFRAECMSDASEFIQRAFYDVMNLVVTRIEPMVINLQSSSRAIHTPDVLVEVQSDESLAHMQSLMRQVADGRVMLQTLRPLPLCENSFERDDSME